MKELSRLCHLRALRRAIFHPCRRGTAEEVLSALQPFVNHGVNHFIIYSYAFAVKPSVAAGYLLEQRRLMRLLKKLTPGVFAVS